MYASVHQTIKTGSSQQRWCSEAGKVTAGLAESNGSQLLGLYLTPPAGCLPQKSQISTDPYRPQYYWCTLLSRAHTSIPPPSAQCHYQWAASACRWGRLISHWLFYQYRWDVHGGHKAQQSQYGSIYHRLLSRICSGSLPKFNQHLYDP